MKKIEKLLAKPWAAYTFAACCAVLLYVILNNLPVIGGWISAAWKVLSPVAVGIVVAYLLNPISDFFELKVFRKMKKPGAAHLWSVIMTVVCLALALALLLWALIPSLVKSISGLISNWESYTEKIQTLIDKVIALAQSRNFNLDLSNMSNLVHSGMSKLVDWLKNNVQTILSAAGSVGSSVSNFAIGVVFGVCFLFAEKTLVRLIAKLRAALIKKDRLERNNDLWRRCSGVFNRYVRCTLLDAVIIGLGAFIFLLIMRMPYAALIAVVVGVTNIIPTFGPMIGGAVGMFFLVLDKPLNALWFFIFICVWQSIDGMIIKPRLFSGSLGIPGVWTLVLIILGGKVAGMLGILLAVPLAAILVIIYHESIAPRINQRIEKINAEPAGADEPTTAIEQ